MQWDLLFTYKAWALESGFFERVYPVVLEMIRRGDPLSRLDKLNPNLKENRFVKVAGIDQESGLKVNSPSGLNHPSVAYIPILGSLTKRGDLCAYGMMDYMDLLARANNSKNVDAIVIEMESPGGTVDGTTEFARAIRESKKPVVVFGDGMVASAAYWLSSQASMIVANENNYVDFGSIGTLYVYENWAKYIEKEIGEVKIIRAPQSKDKALVNMIEPLSEAQEKEIKEDLKAITDFFIQTVKSGRGDRLKADDKEIFTGKMFSKETSLEMGLIDRIGTLQDAVDAAYLLAHENNGGNSKSNTQSKTMKFLKIGSLSGQAGEEAKTEELSAEERASLEAAEQKLTEKDEQLSQLQARASDLEKKLEKAAEEKAAIESEKANLESQISEKDQQIAELQGKLEKKPAGAATTALSDQDKGPEYEQEGSDFKTSVDDEVEKYRSLNGKEPAESQEK